MALAQVFGVSQSAISEWARTRGIPRHVRPRLEAYIRGERSAAASARDVDEMSAPEALVRVLSQVFRDSSRQIDSLPRRYRKRYEKHLDEAIQHLKTDLDDYKSLLVAEFRLEEAARRRNRGK